MCKLIEHKRYHTRKTNYETCNTVQYQKEFKKNPKYMKHVTLYNTKKNF
jgi:hypothetical protein